MAIVAGLDKVEVERLVDVGRAPARQRRHTAGLPGREWLELIGQHLCWNDAKGKHLERAVRAEDGCMGFCRSLADFDQRSDDRPPRA
jgi:hypothetical protein